MIPLSPEGKEYFVRKHIDNIENRLEDAEAHIDAQVKRIEALEELLEDCLRYFKNHSDVVDGGYGEPRPNREMQIASAIAELLEEY